MLVSRISNLSLKNKKVLIRQDLNVPLKDGKVISDVRIRLSIPTIKLALKKGAKVLLMSHLGRPKEGAASEVFSLRPVADYLTKLLGQEVRLEKNYLQKEVKISVGEVVLLENVRFNKGELENDSTLSRKYASLCDVFIMDAFGAAHRRQASTYGVGVYANMACFGLLLGNELDALCKALKNPKRPLVAIVGGSKVSTKLSVLENLSKNVDQLLVGGGIANTFISAAGYKIGKSLAEKDMVNVAKKLCKDMELRGANIPIPTDVVVAKEFTPDATAKVKSIEDVADNDMIFDIGMSSAKDLAKIIASAGTIVWNGPIGVFEFEQFSFGTQVIADAIANSNAFSIAGGGDTLAAIEKFGIEQQISYISTGGGAFLEFLGGEKLPVIEMLENKNKK